MSGPETLVHTVILHEAVCYGCGWSSGLLRGLPAAEAAEEEHSCAGEPPC